MDRWRIDIAGWRDAQGSLIGPAATLWTWDRDIAQAAQDAAHDDDVVLQVYGYVKPYGGDTYFWTVTAAAEADTEPQPQSGDPRDVRDPADRPVYFVDDDDNEYLLDRSTRCTATTATGRRCRNRVFPQLAGPRPDDAPERAPVRFADPAAHQRAVELICSTHANAPVQRQGRSSRTAV